MAKRTSSYSPKVKKRQHVQDSSANDYESTVTDTWITLGNCANTLGLIVPAIKSFENAFNHDPSNLDALCGLSYSLRYNDINLNETVGSQNSIERLNKALDVHPNLSKSPRIFKELAECYLLIGLNDQAHQSIQTAIQLCPSDSSLWLLSAQALIRAGARNHAAGALTRCLSILPESLNSFTKDDIETARAAHAELAAIAAADGNIELSIAELTATLSLPPPRLSRIDEHIALWCALATAKERANDIPGALQACEGAEKAVGSSPRILMTHAYLLLIDNDTKNAEYAITILNKIIEQEQPQPAGEGEAAEPSNEGDFLPWYLLGKAYSLLNSPRAAYDSYQVALRRASNSPITWLAVGKLYLELKQLPDALAAYSQALRLQIDENSPGTTTAWDGLSCVYERCDDQLMDASDACARSAACFKAIGDVKNAQFFEERSQQLSASSKKEAPIPSLRDPPDVPSFLLRDLVALLPSERISFVQGPHQQSQPPSAQPQPSSTPAPTAAATSSTSQQQQPQQYSSQQATPVPAHQSPNPALHTPQTVHQQFPGQRTPQQHLYPLPQPYKQEAKSPRQLAQLPPPSNHQAWSPNHQQPIPIHQQPQYLYQQGPPPPQQSQYQPPPPGPINGSMLPPPRGHQQQQQQQQPPIQRSPLNHPQMIQNGSQYPLGPPGPPPPGYAYGQYFPVQGGLVAHLPYAAAPVNNWRR